MASDGSEAIPEELRGWVDDRAEELGVTRGEVLAQALAALREVDRQESVDAAPGLDAVEERLADLERRVESIADDGAGDREDVAARLDDLDDRVAGLDADLDEMIGDVRERVIQVKRETDGKAPADHGHPDLRETADEAAAAADAAADRLDDVERRVDQGFDNFEEVLEHLTDATDRLEDRTTRLARATVGLRDRVADLEAARSARTVADDIRAKANRHGDTAAACESCSRTVRLGLLSRPECPHCAATFADIDPSSGLFGSATLQTGRPPALDGETTAPDSPDDLLAADEDGGPARE